MRYKFSSIFESNVHLALQKFGIAEMDIEPQKKFEGLTGASGSKPLRFDFYIRSVNILVEADGQQHCRTAKSQILFRSERLLENDRRKEAFAEKCGIVLVRIPYSAVFDRVKETVSKLISPHVQKCT